MKKFISGFVSLATILSAFAFAPVTLADSLSVNFENPPYVLGDIDGQDGWTSTGPFDHAVSSSLGTPDFALQSLRISNAVTSGSFGDQTFSKPLADEAGETSAANDSMSGGTRQSSFEAEFELASAVPGGQQPGLSMSTSPDRGDGARMSYLRFEDQADGIHVFFDDYQDVAPFGGIVGDSVNGCGVGDNFVETDIATLSRSPHTIKFVMDFVDGERNDVVEIYIDGGLEHTGTSWEDYFRYCEGNPTRTVDSLLFRTAGTAAPATSGNGFLVDNLSLLSGVADADAPIVSDVTSATPVVAGSTTTVTANVDDSTTGGSNIAGAEYSIEDGAWVAMSASDGSFDEVSEDVTASFALQPGENEICVRGTDAAGNTSDGLDCTTVNAIDPFTGFVTGGGHLKSGKKTTLNFGGNVGFVPGVGLVGNFQVVDHVAKVACHYDTINSLTIVGNTATFSATGKCNNGTTPTNTFTLQDNGEPGKSDKYNGITIGGGNIQIHEAADVQTFTLYADGSISCSGADDLSDPDGSVRVLPVPGGVFFDFMLDDAEANSSYLVAVSKEPGCSSATFYPNAIMTDGSGDGNFVGFYASGSGAMNLLFNSGTPAPSNPMHREIGTTDAVLLVP